MSHVYPLPLSREQTYLRDALIVCLGGLFLSLIGPFSFPLAYTPVPISLRMQAIFLFAVLFGGKRAFLATAFFLLQAGFGLPVLATGGLVGPSGGYYIGFLIAPCVLHYLNAKQVRPLLSFSVGTAIVYLCGAAYLSTFIGVQKAVLLGVAPFLIGDVFKTLVCLQLIQWWKRR